MRKGHTVIRGVFLLSIFTTFILANPYKNISVDEKITLFTNYFLNESIKSKLPKKPLKGVPKKHEYNYEPTKYELYYNYIQRLKAIEESIKEEQKKLEQKYEADIYKYNKKLKALKKFYSQEKNLYPIFAESFNKALKVVYGKPILIIKSGSTGVQFFLDTIAIYSEKNFTPKPIEFNYADEKRMFNFYQMCDLSVTFNFDNNLLQYDEVICSYKDKIYQGKIKLKTNKKIKLNIKLNDDIFQPIKISNKDKNQ